MNEQKWKKFILELADQEAQEIMQQVNSDPDLKNVHAPEKLREDLFKQIEEYEQSKEGGQ